MYLSICFFASYPLSVRLKNSLAVDAKYRMETQTGASQSTYSCCFLYDATSFCSGDSLLPCCFELCCAVFRYYVHGLKECTPHKCYSLRQKNLLTPRCQFKSAKLLFPLILRLICNRTPCLLVMHTMDSTLFFEFSCSF